MVLAEGGQAAWEALLAEVSPACRATFAEPLSTFRWIEVPMHNELTLAHLRRVGPETIAQRGQATADMHLRQSHPWLLKLLSPETLVRQSPTLFRFNYKGGLIRVDDLNRQDGHFSVWAEGLYPEWYSIALPAYVARALELAGAGTVTFTHAPPEAGFRHRYHLRWG